MVKNIFLLLLLVCNTALFAQNDSKSILDKVSNQTKSSKSITADFTFGMDNAEADIHEVNEGSIAIQGEKYTLDIMGANIFNNGLLQWTLMSEMEECTLVEIDEESDEMFNPAEVFTIYETGYDHKLIGKKSINNTSCYQIELIPSTEQNYSKVTLYIDQSKYQISQAVLMGNDGNTYTINITSYDTSKTYPDAMFEYNSSAYPNVELIDMR